MRRRGGAVLMALWMILASAGPALAAIALETIQVFGVTIVRAQPLVNAVATGNGEWIDVSGLSAMSIHISGITTATVEIDGSNAPTRPADATHGIKLNTVDVTVDQIVFLSLSVRWIKVRVTAYTSGTINAYFEGRAGK